MKIKAPVFNPEISWGTIITIIGFVAGLAVLYGDMREYKARTDLRLAHIEESNRDTKLRLQQVDVTIRNLSEAIVRFTAQWDAKGKL